MDISVNGDSHLFPGCNGIYYRIRSGHRIPGGKDSRNICLIANLVYYKGIPTGYLELVVRGQKREVGLLTDGRDNAVGFDDELGPFYGDGSSATAGIGLTQPHTDALHSGNLAVGAEDSHRSS